MPELTFSHNKVSKLLSDFQAVRIEENRNGKDVWLKDDVVVIRVPSTGSLDWEIVYMIARDQLSIPEWEFDYWMGQNNI